MNGFQIDVKDLTQKYNDTASNMYGKPLGELNVHELNDVVSNVIKNYVIKPNFEKAAQHYSTKRIAIYFSIEFLIGRIVLDIINNCGIMDITEKIFADAGVDIKTLEQVEDAALGNGGLGRLAACFIESAATTGYPLYGYGLYYNYGFFKQEFEGNRQKEVPDDWTRFGESWFERCESDSVTISYQDTQVKAVPYVLPIVGYNSSFDSFKQNVFPLTLWKAEAIEGITNESAARISDTLYPDDSDWEGKKLRLRQEYFFVSATLQKLFKLHIQKHGNLDNFEEYYFFQMNDTHPVLACVEFIRLLEGYGYSFDDALIKARKCFAYTNHTILAEALEKWEVVLFKDMLPDLFKVIEDMNLALIHELEGISTLCHFYTNESNGISKSTDWSKVRKYELYSDGIIHMSRIACYVGASVNGVAAVHSRIIREDTLNEWYKIYPGKFFNVTNGVTPRRWVRLANPYLSSFLDKYIDGDWTTDLTLLEQLDAFKKDTEILGEFADAKRNAKLALAECIYEREGIRIDPDSIFDCQVKRIHEYKRQLMNALRILYIYKQLKEGKLQDFYKTTFIIGGKSAPAYALAKLTISLIKDIQELINNDPDVNDKMQVVFLSDFNVSYGEKVYAGANFSEQISTAGKEASGTGNMKFMMNGSPTIGTMDGANIEIVEKAGKVNNYIFGAEVDEIRGIANVYRPQSFINSIPHIKELFEFLKGGTFNTSYWDIVNNLTFFDPYRVLYDVTSYIEVTLRANADYAEEQRSGDLTRYTYKGFMNTVHSGSFSSDRSIKEYAENIWHIDKITL